ncbi:MAG: leucine-rich repeat protein [Clostridia bacterium]|nr:leucine-rich repeat protein [Clostridia bacterium]
MTKRKILSLLLAVMLIICAFAMVSCNDEEPEVPTPSEKTEWPEAGVYKFAAGISECSLVLNEGDTFTLVYKDQSQNGTYTLSNSTLVLKFEGEAEKLVTANYAVTAITLNYDGANMILYKNLSYTVTFDSQDGTEVASQTVVNGQKATLPENPTREGYDFLGWYKDEAFTSAFSFESPITADTTLYARWEKPSEDMQLPDPEINVTATKIEWQSISGARSYRVDIIAPDGEVVFTQNATATVVNVDFEQFDAAIYTVRVTALAQTGSEDDSSKEVTYAHKALAKVTGFDVISPSLLVFNKVENAEKYYVTVVCGDPDHNHTYYDNGTNRFFSLENCVMGEDGIKVTVTAVAEGFASSTSETFVYKRELGAVTGLVIDEATETVTWNEVENATSYMVSVICGDASHSHAFVSVGSQTSVSIKGCAPCEGGIVVKVYPVTDGYISPEATTLTYEKSGLQTPGALTVNGTVISWNAVTGATSYEVKIGTETYTVDANSYDMAALLNYAEGTPYAISVRAVSDDANSLWTDVLTARYYEMGELAYGKGTLTWAPVVGVAGYEVQVNGGEIVAVDGSTTAAPITFTKAGVNTLKVRFVDGKVKSEWKSIEVYAHAITFDTLGGSEIIVQYKAVGDPITLPTATKAGYVFDAWYNLPGGAASNGKEYTDTVFAGSGSIVLYAQYVAEEYEIDLDFAGGSGTSDKGTVSYENSYTIEVPVAADPALVFAGWFSAPYGKGVQYTDANGNSLAPWTDLEGAKFYAFWVDYTLEYTLTNVNGKPAYMVSAGDRISLVTEITVPATYKGVNVAMIAGNAFLNCTTLEVINLPATIEQISNVSPFGGCTALKEINVYDVEGVSARYWSEDGVLFDNGTSTVATPKLLHMPVAKEGIYTVPAGITEIPEAAFASSKVSKVVIPVSVTKIGREAFTNATNLASVVFSVPEARESASALMIGARAFAGCTSLEKIILPARLSEIKLQKYTVSGETVEIDGAENAFAGCTSLSAITVAAGNAAYKSVDGLIYSADGKTLLYCPAGKTFEDGKLEIPTGTVTVAAGAFVDCSGITEVALPNTVTLVGECAFYGTASLSKVTFGGESFVNLVIGKYAFRDCSNLSVLELEPGSRVSVISEGSFMNCTSLSALTVPATATAIQANAFSGCTGLESISFEASTQELAFGENAFYNCTALASVTLPANVSAIPGIFNGCSSLTSVTVHEDNPYFMSDEEGVVFNKEKTEIVFFPHGKSGDYTLPDTVTSIANGVFKGVSLDSITINNAITSIGDEAFRDSSIYEYIFVGDENTESLTIGNSAFEGASGDELTLPAHTKYIGEAAFARSDFYYGIVLNNGVETLGAYAFYDMEFGSWSADPVIIPPSVKTIGDYCFAEGEYDYVDVEINAEGSVLEYIGKHAFDGNSSFYSFTIPATVKVIDDYAFYNCYYLGYYPSYYGGFSFAADSTLETIGAHAFDYCEYLEEITIPKSVKTIKAYAFANCGGLETVIFEEGGSDDLILGTPYTYSYIDVNGQQVTAIDRGHVFDNCKYLENISLPEHLVEIGEYSFYNAGGNLYSSNLTVSFGENSRLATIGDGAFYYANISTITIPKSVRNLEPVLDEATGEYRDRIGIGNKAFYFLYDSLTEVIFEAGSNEPLTIGEYAFDTCRLLESIELPARLAPYTSYTGEVIPPLANGAGVFNEATALQSVTVSGTDGYYASVEGVLYTADMTELVFCPVAKNGAVSIPATVTKIHDRAFYECVELEAITFVGGEGDMVIGNEAFYGCKKITEIVLPDNVKTIGTEAFYGCSELVAITLPAGLAGFDSGIVGACPKLSTITVGGGENAGFKLVGGVMFSIDGTELIYYPATLDATEYTVPDGVKYIADGAFSGNTMLESITLPEGLIEIGANAFSSCSVLESINIPGSVVLLDTGAFIGCYSLSSVDFADSEEALIIGDKAFYNNSSLESISFPERLAEIGMEAFYSAVLSEVSFAPNSKLGVIGDMAFYRTRLVDVVLPEGIVSIGSNVFSSSYYLESVTFGEGLVTLGDNTFTGCEALVEVYFPASLRTIGKYTFSDKYGDGCAALKTVVFADGSALEAIPEGTFAGCGIESIVIPASVKEIEDKDTSTSYSLGAFWGCSSLATVIFEDNSACTKIGAFAFYQCSALDNFTIPASVVSIGESAFEECSSLSSITIPATTTQLGFEAFRSCSSLATVVLETRATELPGYIFAYCYALETVVIPSTVSSIGSNCFDGCVAAFYVESGSAHYKAVDGILYTADMTEFVFYPAYKTDSSITIPKEIVRIPDGLFYRNEYLREVIFEEGGTEDLTIGENAFYNVVTLYKVVLPARLKAVGDSAFYGCANLATINLPANLAEENVGYDAFYGCDRIVEIYNQSANEIEAGDSYAYEGLFASALRVYTEGESLVRIDEDGYITIALDGEVYLVGYVGGETDLVIPTGVTIINYAAFYDNSDITSVVIPEGVVEIGEYAFYYCTSLANVTLPSTLERIVDRAFSDCYDLGTVLIPESVTEIGSNAFSSCSDALFLIEAASQPDGWAYYWKSSSARTIWGYTGETIVYTFEVDGGTAIDPISSTMPITLPETAVKDGWYFAGWYADEEFTTLINGEYYDATNTVIYAKWITEEQYLEQFLGTSFEMAIVLNVGDTVADSVEEKYQKLYFVFTPETTGYYKFYSTGETKYDPDMNCTLYDSSYNQITFSEDDNGYQFRIIRELTAGETYYFVVSTSYSSSGDYTVTLEEY